MSRKKSVLLSSSVLAGLAAGFLPLPEAARGAVMYGNFVGPNITYQNVTETPTQLPGPSPTQLFGPPALSGDSLMFDPSIFVVSSSGGGIEFQDGHLTTGIVPTSSKGTISVISITEGGGWTVGGGTTATTAMESLLINQLFITSVNGTPVTPIVVTPTITFTDTDSGTATVTKGLNTIQFNSSGSISTGTWNATASFNLPAALASAGDTGTVTGLQLDLDNQLAAESETTSIAFIDKKFFNITTSGATVPEPATASAALIGIAGLLQRRSRRRNSATVMA